MARQVLTLPDIPASVLTQALGDARYPLKTDPDPYPVYYNQSRGDARYLLISNAFTQALADARYPLKTDVDPYPQYYNQTRGDARYLQSSTASSTYLPLAGGTLTGALVVAMGTPPTISLRQTGDTQPRTVLNQSGLAVGPGGSTANDTNFLRSGVATWQVTGHLTPQGTNTYDLGGGTSLRWRKDWAVDADYSGSVVVAVGLTVAAKAVALSPNANQTLQWLANGFFSDSPTKAQYDALVSRVTALETAMGSGTGGHYHTMGTWRQTNKATLSLTELTVPEEVPAA